MSCSQLPSVILVPQLNGELLCHKDVSLGQSVHYVSLTDEQLARFAASNALLAAATKADKIQDSQVIDFLTLNEDVQFIKNESCGSPSPRETTDDGDFHETSPLSLDTFDSSPLLHEASKHVALSTSIHSQSHDHIQLSTLTQPGEFDAATEELLLAQLQQSRNNSSTTEVDDDERAASEYLTDGQLYLEKSKRSEKCTSIPMDCSDGSLIDAHATSTTGATVRVTDVSTLNTSNVITTLSRSHSTTPLTVATAEIQQQQSRAQLQQLQSASPTGTHDIAEVTSTTLEPMQVHATLSTSVPVTSTATVNIVEPVNSGPTTLQLHGMDNKIRVLSLSGTNLLSSGEPLLLGNILLVPDTTPTVKLQIVQDDSCGMVKEVNVRGLAEGTVSAANILTATDHNQIQTTSTHTQMTTVQSNCNTSMLSNSNATHTITVPLMTSATTNNVTGSTSPPATIQLQISNAALQAAAQAAAQTQNNLQGQNTTNSTTTTAITENILQTSSQSVTQGVNESKKSSRPFQCKLCSATFNRLGNYTRHQRIHTVRCEEDERFHCEECGKSFIQRCDLTRHLHVHAGTEPHRCNLCGKGYIRHSDLVTHQRFHNKEKPFGCPHCQKGFSQRGDLNRHLRSIHLQIRPLTCGHCQKKFAKEATLIRHMRTSHREMLLQSLLIKSGGDAAAISEALITGTGDICTPSSSSGQE